jgi:hypothetical protein
MTGKALIFCGWCGIATVILMMVGLGPIAHLTPPPSPLISATEIAASFQHNATGILVGSFLANIGVAMSIALIAGISAQIHRMESASAPVLSYLQLGSGVAASAFVMLPVMIWNAAAFRADRSPDMILLLHDLATFATYVPFSVATLNEAVIGFAILSDRSAKPVFPRWLGYYNLLTGLSYIPMGLIGLFKAGPFASDGFIAWWLPTILVLPWYVLMGTYLIKIGKAESASSRILSGAAASPRRA